MSAVRVLGIGGMELKEARQGRMTHVHLVGPTRNTGEAFGPVALQRRGNTFILVVESWTDNGERRKNIPTHDSFLIELGQLDGGDYKLEVAWHGLFNDRQKGAENRQLPEDVYRHTEQWTGRIDFHVAKPDDAPAKGKLPVLEQNQLKAVEVPEDLKKVKPHAATSHVQVHAPRKVAWENYVGQVANLPYLAGCQPAPRNSETGSQSSAGSDTSSRMDPRIHFITLAVRDFERAVRFYRDGLGLPMSKMSGDDVAFFGLGGMVLALYPWDKLAADAMVPAAGAGFHGFALAHNVRNREDVAGVLATAVAAGARLVKAAQDTFWEATPATSRIRRASLGSPGTAHPFPRTAVPPAVTGSPRP